MDDFREKVGADLPKILNIASAPEREIEAYDVIVSQASVVASQAEALHKIKGWAGASAQGWPKDAPAQESAPPLENGAAAVTEATEIVKGKTK